MAHNPYLAYADDPMLVIGHATHAGRSGKNNEDLYAVFDTRFDADATGFASQRVLVVAVADGIGGSVAGEMASDLAVQAVATGFRDTHKPAPVRLDTAIRRANGDIYRNSMDNPALAGMGTTIVAAVIGTDQIQVGHAGDSRAYLLRAGVLSLLTLDHSWAQEALDAGRLTVEEARIHPNRHVIKRFLGGAPDLEVDYRIVDPATHATQTSSQHTYRERIEFVAGDTLLFCTDGLTDVVSDATIATILTKNAPQQAADKLINEANRAGGPDNITVVIVRKAGGTLPLAGVRRASFMAVLLLVLLVALAGAGALLLRNFNVFSSAAAPETMAAVTPAETQSASQSGESTAQAAPAALADQPAAGALPGATVAQNVEEAVPTRPFGFSPSTLQTPTARAGAESINTAAAAAANGMLTPTVTAAPVQAVAALLPPVQAAGESMIATEASPVPTATARRATSTPVTPTEIATPTPRPAATSLPTATPPPRSTAIPVAGESIATPGALPTLTAVSTATAAEPLPVQMTPPAPGGPTSVNLSEPRDGDSILSNVRQKFSWTANPPLDAGQGYELVFWQLNETPDQGRAPVDASPDAFVEFEPKETGTRHWGVWLVSLDPYNRIRYLGGGRTITFSAPPEKESRKDEASGPTNPDLGGGRP